MNLLTNVDDIETFLNFLGGGSFNWRLLDDRKENRDPVTFTGGADALGRHAREPMGAFVMVNGTDGRGREIENVTEIRAVFLDIDDGPLPDSWPLRPSLIASRDARHHHVYWRVTGDFPRPSFKPCVQRINRMFGGETNPSFGNPAQIMRVPGTPHYKEDPTAFRIVTHNPGSVYTFDDLAAAFGPFDDVALNAPSSSGIEAVYSLYRPALQKYRNELARQPDVSDGEGREAALFRLACLGKNLAVPPDQRLPLLMEFNLSHISPPLSPATVEAKNRNAERYSAEPVGALCDDYVGEEYHELALALQPYGYVVPFGVLKHLRDGFEIPAREIGFVFDRYCPVNRAGRPKMTALAWLKNHSPIPICEQVTYVPGADRLIRSEAGRDTWLYNTYTPPDLRPEPGDMEWFDGLMTYMIPDNRQREQVIDWLAHLAQDHKNRAKFALLIHSTVKGIGKSFLGQLMSMIVGRADYGGNSQNISNDTLIGLSTHWVQGKRLIICDEVYHPQRGDIISRLSELITEPIKTVKRLHADPYETRIHAAFMLFTNHLDALRIDPTERRFLVISSPAKKRGPDYWSALWDGGEPRRELAAALYHYLLNRRITAINPLASAPETPALHEMATLNRDDLTALLTEWWEDGEGGDNPLAYDVVKPETVARDHRITGNHRFTVSKVRKFLLANGAVQLHQVRHRKTESGVTRSKPLAIRNVEKWLAASTAEIVNELERSFPGGAFDEN